MIEHTETPSLGKETYWYDIQNHNFASKPEEREKTPEELKAERLKRLGGKALKAAAMLAIGAGVYGVAAQTGLLDFVPMVAEIKASPESQNANLLLFSGSSGIFSMILLDAIKDTKDSYKNRKENPKTTSEWATSIQNADPTLAIAYEGAAAEQVKRDEIENGKIIKHIKPLKNLIADMEGGIPVLRKRIAEKETTDSFTYEI